VSATPALIALALAAPLALALASTAARRRILPLAWLAPLPALALAVAGEQAAVLELPWLLTGVAFGMDAAGRTFLLFTSLLWLLSGLFAQCHLRHDPAAARFHVFFLVALAGNLGLVLARDMVGFYLGFAVMSFAAYVLVIHDGSGEARRAGLVYIVLVAIGEALVIAGVVVAAAEAGTELAGLGARLAHAPHRDLIAGLLLAGFGIKAGAVPLHVWLPLAHPVAPAPASAVLSGAMIKAGLLGWLRFLPPGEAALPGAGELCIAIGMLSAFYGVAVGIAQSDAKTVLAYSSISQMGLMIVGVGAGLSSPEAWPVAAAAVATYASHHGLAKGALFLGTAIAGENSPSGLRRHAVAAGLVLPALALAGAPLTSGMPAKAMLKQAVSLSGSGWASPVLALLPVAAVGTALLLARFLVLAWPRARRPRPVPWGLMLPWGLLLAAVASLAWIVPAEAGFERALEISAAGLWEAAWPVALGGGLAAAAIRLPRVRAAGIAPGDLLVPIERLTRAALPAAERAVRACRPGPAKVSRWIPALLGRALDTAAALPRWPAAMTLFLIVLLVAALALAAGGG
jgi:formate hydrogenlyase subunit 3/multisubunit Na+/H+ antiporter MnhD subunit